jgi:hypothetical protein
MRPPEHRAEVVVDRVHVVGTAADEDERLEAAKRHQVAERDRRRDRVAEPRLVIDFQFPEELKLRQVVEGDERIGANPTRSLRVESRGRPVGGTARLTVKNARAHSDEQQE